MPTNMTDRKIGTIQTTDATPTTILTYTIPANSIIQQQILRLGRLGEQVGLSLIPSTHGLADEGSQFVTSTTPGTGIGTIAAQASLADTAPFAILKNIDMAGGKRAYVQYVKLICTAAGTLGASIRYAFKLDQNRADPTGAASPLNPGTPVNCNMDDVGASICRLYAGALVAPAATAAVRLLGSGLIRNVIPVVGDTYLIVCGGIDPSMSSLIQSGTALADRTLNHPAVVAGPGQSVYFHLWLPGQTAASSFEIEIGHFER